MFIHPVVDIWVVTTLGLLINNDAINILLCVSWCDWENISFERILRIKFLGLKVCSHCIKNDGFPKFMVFISPPTVYESFMFSTPGATLGVITLFNISHSDGCVVAFHVSINLHVPGDY